MKKNVIIIIGPPGSGKGTQAQLLSEKFNLYYLETSKIIDANLKNIREGDFVVVKSQKYFLTEERKLRQGGKLMSPELISFWTEKKIKELSEEGKKIVLAGSPRTLYEGKEIIPLLKELYNPENIGVVLIDLSEEESIRRSCHRRICALMRHPILYSEETKNLTKCPFDGSDLIIRKDDNVESLKIRMREYKERTLPLIDYFKEEGLKIYEVAGKKTPAELHYDILKILK